MNGVAGVNYDGISCYYRLDRFFAARSSSHVASLENLIRNREDICICGIILTEVLQGIRKDSEPESIP